MPAVKSFTETIHGWIEVIKTSGINGCITGSCLLDKDFDTWSEKPDIDVFTYSNEDMIEAINILCMKYGFKFGVDGSDHSYAQEYKKYGWLKGSRKKANKFAGTVLSTIKLNQDGVIVNVSNKPYQTKVSDVICDFDMTIIMKGWDIPSGFMFDLTDQWCSANEAHPNKLRRVDTDMLVVAYWVRQFNRVIKYWERGFDTRPMAEFYIEQIDSVLEQGPLFDSDKAHAFYDEFAEEFIETRNDIARWLDSKKEA